jgi:hypothetical protein
VARDNTNGAIRHLELYRWVGATWIKMSTNGTVPHSTVGNHAVYDEARKRIIVQGGNGISTYGGQRQLRHPVWRLSVDLGQ